jgi:hypothetical protein
MAQDFISPDLKAFLLRYLDSVGQLEALLLLYRERQRSWDAREVAQRLYTSEADAIALLAHLAADGLIAVGEDGFRYCPLSVEQADLVEKLAVTYARHLIPVTNIIHAKPRRVREFANAFKLKKD